jgi:TolB protein
VRRVAAIALAAGVLAGCGGSGKPPRIDLAFVSTRDGDYAIFGVAATGGSVHRLDHAKGNPATPQGLFFQTEPAWSPDGSRIAFVSKREGNDHVYVMNADGKDTRRLTSSSQDDAHPSWSPDGKRIVFSREGALFTVSSSGGAVSRLGKGLGNAADPAWSPNGKWVAYDYRQPGGPEREIWVIGSDGSHRRQLTHLNASSDRPAWSPDSRRIAFDSDQSGHFEIYTMSASGGGVAAVTKQPIDSFAPDYSPDGRLIAFGRDGGIWTIDRAGTERQLTSGGNDSMPVWRPRERLQARPGG